MNPWILYTEFTFIKTFSISIAESRKNKKPGRLRKPPGLVDSKKI
ncbi:hypothetical protein LEP1GSC096_4215 [Leptospira interrogans serovar Hebdomadis str. R499]|nr:hypothetical protein LEP1GSC045_0770 [Leptospira interrogans serovar Pomona str. Kennewicki LC82-25]EKN97793.1 hypothetical protein LEP1GSC014_3541 [Leptospira interrogans serovar Pomona str. Pomona]EKR26066.1 hypothetical protein LEP1GSC087_4790 [Leptospira interrogans serovar Bataviae str. L1111]EKR36002.1 hypothetical protein LEP1GSC096_4215 [Leptospira interrogans serovar Hebdomadis str. R499]EMF35318.1 hypothetical protein LEP1GSC201_2765 [Leptospira interrogans serovar Pomona str. Fox 